MFSQSRAVWVLGDPAAGSAGGLFSGEGVGMVISFHQKALILGKLV